MSGRKTWDEQTPGVPLSAYTLQQQRSRTPTRANSSRLQPQDIESREKGFNTYISGANEERIKEQIKRQHGPSNPASNAASQQSTIEEPSEGKKARRQWSESPAFRQGQVALRGEDGSVLTTPVITPRTASPLPRTHAPAGAYPPYPQQQNPRPQPQVAPPPAGKQMATTATGTGDSLWPPRDPGARSEGTSPSPVGHSARYSDHGRGAEPEDVNLGDASVVFPRRLSSGLASPSTTATPGDREDGGGGSATHSIGGSLRSRSGVGGSVTPTPAAAAPPPSNALPPPPRSNSLRMLAMDAPLRAAAAGSARGTSRGVSPSLSQGASSVPGSRRESGTGDFDSRRVSQAGAGGVDSPAAGLSRRGSLLRVLSEVSSSSGSDVMEEDLAAQPAPSTSSQNNPAPLMNVPPKVRIMSATSRLKDPGGPAVRSLAAPQATTAANRRPPSTVANTAVLLAAQRPGTAQSTALQPTPSILRPTPTRESPGPSPAPILRQNSAALARVPSSKQPQDMAGLLAALQKENEVTASTPLSRLGSVPLAAPRTHLSPPPLPPAPALSSLPAREPFSASPRAPPPSFLTPPKADPAPAVAAGPREVVLRILSTWAGTGEVGLTELELLDASSRRIKPAGIDVRGLSRPLTWTQRDSLARLVDGECRTTDPSHMFLVRTAADDTVEFVVKFPVGAAPAAFGIWNYNRSFLDASKGVREVEVHHDGRRVWAGPVPRAAGNPIDTSHCVRVALQDGALLPSAAAQPDVRSSMAINAPTPSAEPFKPAPEPAAVVEPREDPLRDSFLDRIVNGMATSTAPATAASSPASHVSPSRATPLPTATATAMQLRVQSGRRAGIVRENSRVLDEAKAFFADVSAALPEMPRQPSLLSKSATREDIAPIPSDSEPQLQLPPNAPQPDESEDGPKFGRRRPRKLQSTEESLRSIAQFDRSHLGRLGTVAERAAEPAAAPVLTLTIEPAAAELDAFPMQPEDALSSLLKRPATTHVPEPATPVNARVPSEETDAACDPFAAHGDGLERERTDTDPPSSSSHFSALVDGALGAAASVAVEPKESAPSGPLYEELFGAAPFAIPELPSGAILEVIIYSTWGDGHYVGLNGLELFDGTGRAIAIADPEEQVSAAPDSVNELPGIVDDPRTPDKLFDGIHMTCDDLHAWLTPFTAGQRHTISIDLGDTATLGCLRFWNLNKSRVHASRGARLVEVCLDGVPIFRGEIAKAPGAIDPFFAETILFTEDDQALEAIEDHDERYRLALRELEPALSLPRDSSPGPAGLEVVQGPSPADAFLDRPLTAAAARPAPASVLKALKQGGGSSTAAAVAVTATATAAARDASPAAPEREISDPSSLPPPPPPAPAPHIVGSEVVIEVLEQNHGDKWYMGLSGLEVLDVEGRVVAVAEIAAFPSDVNVLKDLGLVSAHAPVDPRTIDKLINGIHVTSEDGNMWLAPTNAWIDLADPGARPAPPTPAVGPTAAWLRLTLAQPTELSALRIYNYNSNKSSEDTARGLKRVRILVDGDCATCPEGVYLRRAPGHTRYPFGQTIALFKAPAGGPEAAPLTGAREEGDRAWLAMLLGGDAEAYQRALLEGADPRGLAHLQTCFDVPMLPSGFVITLVVRSTHGDEHFLGLTGLEVVDAVVGVVPASALKICVSPIAAVREMPGMASDCRTPEKLLDGVNTGAAPHTWLAPVMRESHASVADSDRSSLPGRFQLPGQGAEYERGAVSVISLVLDRPLLLACLRFFNYGPRHPQRGVKDMEVYLDNRHIFSGALAAAAAEGPPAPQSVLFSAAPAVIAQYGAEVLRGVVDETEQSILCLDDGEDRPDASLSVGHVDQAKVGYGAKALFGGVLPPRPSTAIVQ